jgi:hypothetical protein
VPHLRRQTGAKRQPIEIGLKGTLMDTRSRITPPLEPVLPLASAALAKLVSERAQAGVVQP